MKRVLLVVGLVCALAGQVQAAEVVIGAFTLPGTWHLTLGPEFPGARGALQVAEVAGRKALVLAGDFRTGGNYVGAIRKLPGGLSGLGLAFAVLSRDTGALTVRFQDASGQLFQGAIHFPRDGEWHEVTTGPFDRWAHFGGADDGVVHQPLQAVWLLLDAPALAHGKEGEVCLAEVKLLTRGAQAMQEPKAIGARAEAGGVQARFTPRLTGEYATAAVDVQVKNAASDATRAVVELHAVNCSPAVNFGGKRFTFALGPGEAAKATWVVPAELFPLNPYVAQKFDCRLQVGRSYSSACAWLLPDRADQVNFGQPRTSRELPDNPFGICVHLGGPQVEKLDLVAEAGLGWVRDDFYWSRCEQKPGEFAIPPEWDAYVQAAAERGIELLALLNGGNAKCYPDDPYNPEAFARFAGFFARHFKGQVPVYEILNEPLGQMAKYGYWHRYAKLVNLAAKAIKAADPSALVVANTAYPHDSYVFIPQFDAEVDGISLHPYDTQDLVSGDPPFAEYDKTFPSELKVVKQWLAAARCGKVVIQDEFGWPTYYPVIEKKSGYEATSCQAQAEYLVRRYLESFAGGCKLTLAYDLVDDGRAQGDAEHHFGLLYNDLTPKPSYYALQRLTSLFAETQPQMQALFEATFKVKLDTRTLWDMPRDYAERLKAQQAHYGFKNAAEAQNFVLDPADLESFWFIETRTGLPLVALWQRRKVMGLNPFLADLALRTHAFKYAACVDLVSGRVFDLPVEQTESGCVIHGIPVGSAPQVVRLLK